MEANSFSTRNRRASLGRSSLIERSINILRNFLSDTFDQEEFDSLVINNEVPGEFRSIMWRVNLGILSHPHSKKTWIINTLSYRKNFEEIFNQENFQTALDYYINMLNNSNQGDRNFKLTFNFDDEFTLIKNELTNYSNDYDIFKSDSLKRTFLAIYLAWRWRNVVDLNEHSITFICKILAILIYSLYPSIIHLNQNFDEINENEEDLKNIFYFLNSEDYFEHDVHEVLDKLLKVSDLNSYVIKYSTGSLENPLNTEIKKIAYDESSIEELFEKKLNLNTANIENNFNFIEKISYLFLYSINKNTSQTLHMKGVDVYKIVANSYLSLLYDFTKFENISYYMDSILIYCKTENLRFLGYLIISSFILLEDQMNGLSKEQIESYFADFPLLKKDPKEFVGKALKIREKINDRFYKN